MAQFTDTPITTDRFTHGLSWASKIHQKQVRKDGTPYINHLLQVAGLVLEAGGSEDQAIAGLLHDSVEDLDIDIYDIEDRFGMEVRRMVNALSISKDPMIAPQSSTLAYCQNIQMCPDAILVSAADKLHNLRGYVAGLAEFLPRHSHLYGSLLPIYRHHLGNDHRWVKEMEGYDYVSAPDARGHDQTHQPKESP